MDDKLISAFSKIINSYLLKSVYPMVDHIDIVSLEKNLFFQVTLVTVVNTVGNIKPK